MKWKRKSINLGDILAHKKQTVIFQALEPLDISVMTASCGCTKPTYNPDDNTVSVIYSPGSIPVHLLHQGFYKATKTITVHYKDGQKDLLTLTATVKDKL